MPSAPSRENTPRPTIVLIPSRLAPAAPAKDPLGTAWATKADPRRTTKNPTTPATRATIVASVQVLTMKPENTSQPSPATTAGFPPRLRARHSLGTPASR